MDAQGPFTRIGITLWTVWNAVVRLLWPDAESTQDDGGSSPRDLETGSLRSGGEFRKQGSLTSAPVDVSSQSAVARGPEQEDAQFFTQVNKGRDGMVPEQGRGMRDTGMPQSIDRLSTLQEEEVEPDSSEKLRLPSGEWTVAQGSDEEEDLENSEAPSLRQYAGEEKTTDVCKGREKATAPLVREGKHKSYFQVEDGEIVECAIDPEDVSSLGTEEHDEELGLEADLRIGKGIREPSEDPEKEVGGEVGLTYEVAMMEDLKAELKPSGNNGEGMIGGLSFSPCGMSGGPVVFPQELTFTTRGATPEGVPGVYNEHWQEADGTPRIVGGEDSTQSRERLRNSQNIDGALEEGHILTTVHDIDRVDSQLESSGRAVSNADIILKGSSEIEPLTDKELPRSTEKAAAELMNDEAAQLWSQAGEGYGTEKQPRTNMSPDVSHGEMIVAVAKLPEDLTKSEDTAVTSVEETETADRCDEEVTETAERSEEETGLTVSRLSHETGEEVPEMWTQAVLSKEHDGGKEAESLTQTSERGAMREPGTWGAVEMSSSNEEPNQELSATGEMEANSSIEEDSIFVRGDPVKSGEEQHRQVVYVLSDEMRENNSGLISEREETDSFLLGDRSKSEAHFGDGIAGRESGIHAHFDFQENRSEVHVLDKSDPERSKVTSDSLPWRRAGDQVQPNASDLDFSAQKSRIAVKNPSIRPPKNPRSLLHKPSVEATPPKPSGKLPAKGLTGVPLGGFSIGIKLPGLGAGPPVLKKTHKVLRDEDVTESPSRVTSAKPIQVAEAEDESAEKEEMERKPKWIPPKQPGFGNLLMSELKTKLNKTTEG